METNKLVAGIVAAAIAIIVLAGVLMPALSNATDTDDKFINEGYYDMTYSLAGDLELAWDHSKPTIITVNDEDITMPELTNGNSRTVLCGDDWLIRYGYGTTLGGYYIQWYPSSGAAILASVGNSLDLTVTCSSGTVSVTDNDSTPHTATASYTYTYCVADNGDYVMKKADESAYVLGDSTVYAMGLTNVGTYTSTGIKITGTIDDGMTWSVFRGTGTFTFTDEEVNYTEVSSHKDLYLLDSMTATVSQSDQSADVVYSFFIVPAEVTAEKAQHLSDAQIVILDVIPLLIIVAVLLGVVAVFILRRE